MNKNKTINARIIGQYRRKLLATTSGAALMAALAVPAIADGSRSPLWIDFGWHFERYTGAGDSYAPPFTTPWTATDFLSPLKVQDMRMYSYGADGKISFQPDGSDWLFTASARIGRTHGRKHPHQQNQLPPYFISIAGGSGTNRTLTVGSFADTEVSSNETHAIVDFQVGRDVGLGLFGAGSKSDLGFGVRFAQFGSDVDVSIHARPSIDVHLVDSGPFRNIPLKYFHSYVGKARAERNFHGVGPSISWSGSAPIFGDPDDGQAAFDWGVNAALLFGKQKAKTSHETTSYYFRQKYYGQGAHVQTGANHARERSVIVPNLGGFAGISFRYSDAKLRLGYRADFFFGAIDGGWDVRQSTTRGFHGPFASISIGIGD